MSTDPINNPLPVTSSTPMKTVTRHFRKTSKSSDRLSVYSDDVWAMYKSAWSLGAMLGSVNGKLSEAGQPATNYQAFRRWVIVLIEERNARAKSIDDKAWNSGGGVNMVSEPHQVSVPANRPATTPKPKSIPAPVAPKKAAPSAPPTATANETPIQEAQTTTEVGPSDVPLAVQNARAAGRNAVDPDALAASKRRTEEEEQAAKSEPEPFSKLF